MSVQTVDPQPPPGLKRSGSINILRGRTSSMRRKDGHKRSASNQPTIPLQNVSLSAPAHDAWNSRRPSLEKRPVVAYAVTITAGNNDNNQKPREKRRIFERILHKRSQSKALLPQICEADGSRTPKRSITPALFREEPLPSKRPSRGHSRSASALSFFQQETALPIPEDDEGVQPWPPSFAATQRRPATSEDSTPRKHSPITSRYNPTQIQRKPAPTRTISDDTTSLGLSSDDSKPERPKLTVITDPTKSTSQSLPNMLNATHPPRKSSLPGSEAVLPQVDPEALSSSKDALTKSFESSAKHRRKRSQDMVDMVGPVINVLDPIGPTPPPKDNDKGYHVQHFEEELQKGLNVTIPDRSPLRVSKLIDEAGTRQKLRTNNQATSKPSNQLPPPQLSAPRQSGLSTRRRQIPSSLQVASKSRKAGAHAVVGSLLTPTSTPNRVAKSRGSSRNSSRTSSPAIISKVVNRGVSNKSARILGLAPPVPARRAPPPPLAVKIPKVESQPESQHPTLAQLQSLSLSLGQPVSHPDSIIRAPILSEAEKRPTPPAKSPKRVAAMKRRSVSDGHVPLIGGTHRNSYRRKSIHRRKPTGFRLTKEKEAVLRGRQEERPNLPTSLEQTAISVIIGRRQQSPSPRAKPTKLTPPQQQGEWAVDSRTKEKGRRQPSPMHNAITTDSRTHKPRARRPTIERGTSDSSTSSSNNNNNNNNTNSNPTSHSNTRATSSASNSTALRPGPTLEQHQTQFEQIRSQAAANRLRAPSRTAGLGMASATANPLSSHPTVASSAEVRAVGGATLVEQKVTPEESIKRMMERQERQAVAMRMKLLGIGGREGREGKEVGARS